MWLMWLSTPSSLISFNSRNFSEMGQAVKLFLVGYMGCGKSSIGKRLARRTGWQLLDTDSEIEREDGASVSDIFRYEGEEYFRRREQEVLSKIIQSSEPMIISTGGGLPIWGDNMERMNQAGVTIYLRRSAENIASRLSPYGRQRRPKLRGLSDEELVAFMRKNIVEREPRYLKASVAFDGDLLRDEDIVEEILKMI